MVGWLLKHQWKSEIRSSVWHRNALVNLFLGLSVVYLAGNFLFLGFLLDDILLKIFPRESPLEQLNKYLLYYFFAGFIVRYFFQKLPALDILPYLHLPVKKSSLSLFMLVRSMFGIYNLLGLFLFLPFAFDLVLPYYSTAEFAGWTAGIASTILFANYLLIYIKRVTDVKIKAYLLLIGTFATLVALEYFDVFDFSAISGALFDQLFLNPWVCVLPLTLALGAFALNLRYLKGHMYAEDLVPAESSSTGTLQTGFLTRFGKEGVLMDTEFKLIWRNKRPRSVLLITGLFLFYGLLIFTNPENEGSYLLYILFAIIIVGMFTLNYGQYLLGWEGSHFDQILTRGVDFKTLYRSKFYLLALVSTVCLVLATPYVYFGWDILYLLFCTWLFNIGINTCMVMFFGSINPKKIELGKSTVFNWQGVGAAQFLLGLPVILLPVLIFSLFSWLISPMAGITALGVAGFLGLLMAPLFINGLAAFMKKRRHEIADGFRNS